MPALKPWSGGGLVEASSVLPGWVTGGTSLGSAAFCVPFWVGEWATKGDSSNGDSGNDEAELSSNQGIASPAGSAKVWAAESAGRVIQHRKHKYAAWTFRNGKPGS